MKKEAHYISPEIKMSGNYLPFTIFYNMKTIILAALVYMFTCTSCMEEIAAPKIGSCELYVQIEQEDHARTVMDDNNNIRWSEGDQIIAFLKTSLGQKYQIKDEYVGKTSGYFSQVSSDSSSDLGTGMELDHNVVYYPYSSAVECEKAGSDYSMSVVLPSEQPYATESFGNVTFPMVAVSESSNLTFKNVCGGIMLQLKGTQKIISIMLEGKNNEKLAGTATVTAYSDGAKPSITMTSNAYTSVTLNCGPGVQIYENIATEFIISLPPVLFSKGFTVTITDTENKTYILETDKANTVIRSSLLIMPEVRLGTPAGDDSDGGDFSNEKKLIKLASSDDFFISFTYDDQERLIEAKRSDGYKQAMTWGDDAVKLSAIERYDGIEYIDSYTLSLSNGLVQSCCFDNYQPYIAVYNQSDRLIKWGDSDSEIRISWEGDKLVSATEYDEYGYIYDYTITYEKSCRKGYFPLSIIMDLEFNFYLYFAHPELLGLRTSQLPASVTYTYDDNSSSTHIYSYEFDNDGYISKVTESSGDSIYGILTLTWE